MNHRLGNCALLFVAVFTSCSPAKSESSSESKSEEYEIVNKQEISLMDFFLQEDDYLVFCHSDTCTQCKQIIGDVASFAEDNIIKTYFLNVSLPDNKITLVPIDEITIGVNSINDLVYAGTPTIFEVKNGITTSNIAGKDKCLTFLNEIRKNQIK